jgi:proton-dependent oligopeptide transporter, POT family
MSTTVPAASATATAEPTGSLFGHPKGLYVLFLTEMWERFSFYGVRSLLVFFLTERFLFSDDRAFAVYGAYSALVYVYPLIGGALADRYLGYSRCVTYGALLMIAGHSTLVAQDLYFSASRHASGAMSAAGSEAFFFALALLIAGVGLLKSNISTMVGALYSRDSALRDAGFTIFNWGINIGSMLAAFVCGYVGEKYGWAYGFGLAGSGMALGLIIFTAGQKHLRHAGDPPRPLARLGGRKALALVAFVAVTILATWKLIQLVDMLGYLVFATTVLALGRVLYVGYRHLGRVERERTWCALLIWGVWTSYAALVEQMGSSINLFNERAVDRVVRLPQWLGGGTLWEFEPAQLLGVTGFLLVILSPVFVWLWSWLERRSRSPSTPAKVVTSLFCLAGGYGAVAAGTLWPDATGHVHLFWLVLLYLFFAIAALIAGPIGLSAVTRLAATRIVGFLVGLWMLGVAVGNSIAAWIARFSSLDTTRLAAMSPAEMLGHYRAFFGTLAIAATFVGLVFTAATPAMKRWMHGLR